MAKFNPMEHLTNLRGQQYMEVKWRMVWFRETHPGGAIVTEIVSTTPLIMRAIVSDAEGRTLGTGHGSASSEGKKVVWAGKDTEKAETAAIGRALAVAGFGTQFAGNEIDEGDHLADSPITPPADTLVDDAENLGGVVLPHKRPALVDRFATHYSISAGAAAAGLKKHLDTGTITADMTDDEVVAAIVAANAAKNGGAA